MDSGAAGTGGGEHRIDGLAAVILDDTLANEVAGKDDAVLLPDDLLPGVGVAQVPLRSALRTGGASMVAVLILVQIVEQLDRVAMAVLAPDIQRSLHVSDAVLGADGKADPEKLDLVGRLGGESFARTRERFALKRPDR